MSLFAKNLKFLRKRRNFTQEDVAQSLDFKRPTLSGYENEVSEPGISDLLKLAEFYKISLDTLLKIDIASMSEFQLRQLESGTDPYIRGSNIRVLATTVNHDNEENIELVTEKAKAGYKTGFADPEYIKVLPTFTLPFLSKNRKYRTFQISGDSMLPIPDGSYVTTEFIPNWNLIRDRRAYVILTHDDGVVFKVVENQIREFKKLVLHSLNPVYSPYDIPLTDIREVWQFVHYISPELPEPLNDNDRLLRSVNELRQEVAVIRKEISGKKTN